MYCRCCCCRASAHCLDRTETGAPAPRAVPAGQVRRDDGHSGRGVGPAPFADADEEHAQRGQPMRQRRSCDSGCVGAGRAASPRTKSSLCSATWQCLRDPHRVSRPAPSFGTAQAERARWRCCSGSTPNAWTVVRSVPAAGAVGATAWPRWGGKLGRVFAVNGRSGPLSTGDNRTFGTDVLPGQRGVFALVSGGAPGQTQPTSIRTAVSWRFPPICPFIDHPVFELVVDHERKVPGAARDSLVRRRCTPWAGPPTNGKRP